MSSETCKIDSGTCSYGIGIFAAKFTLVKVSKICY